MNDEISVLFNKGFHNLKSKHLNRIDKDYLFILEHSSKDQIIKDYKFEATKSTDYLSSIQSFTRVLKLKPNHSLTYSMIGRCYASYSYGPANPMIKNFENPIEIERIRVRDGSERNFNKIN
jgi:hypothetical protein